MNLGRKKGRRMVHPRVITERNSKGNAEFSFCYGRRKDPQVRLGEDSGMPRSRRRTAEAGVEDENCMAAGLALTVENGGHWRPTLPVLQST